MNIPAPPEGFELENQAPPPPEGFVLEGEQPAASSKPSGGSALEAFGSNYLDVPTMGMATAARAKIGSMIHGTSYPEEYQRIKSKQSAAQEAHPTASMIGTGAGIGASALLPARLATIPAALGAGAASGAAAGYGETGTGEGAVTGAGLGLAGAGAGALAGRALAPAVNAIGRRIPTGKVSELTGEAPTLIPKAEKVITAADKKAEGQGLYKQAFQNNINLKPSSLAGMRENTQRALEEKSGYSPFLSSQKSTGVLSAMDKMKEVADNGGPVSFHDLEKLRQSINKNLLTDADDATRRTGYVARDEIDKILDNVEHHFDDANMHPDAVNEAKDFLQNARKTWSISKKLDDIETAYVKAQRRAESTYSGGNLDNTIRQEFNKILNKDLKFPGRWSEAEKAAIKKVQSGGGKLSMRNMLRLIGNSVALSGLAGKGEVPGAIAAAMMGHPVTAAGIIGTGLAGNAMKTGAVKVGEKDIEALKHLIARGHVPYEPATGKYMNQMGALLGGYEAPRALERASGGRIPDYTKLAERECRKLGGQFNYLQDYDDEAIANALRLARGGQIG